jgi:hypothetical protein
VRQLPRFNLFGIGPLSRWRVDLWGTLRVSA